MNITVVNKAEMPVPKFGSLVVYVGRPTPLGNPFRIKTGQGRKAVVKLYRAWLWEQMKQEKPAGKWISALAEKAKQGVHIYLQCWCAPKACHADVIKRAIEYKVA